MLKIFLSVEISFLNKEYEHIHAHEHLINGSDVDALFKLHMREEPTSLVKEHRRCGPEYLPGRQRFPTHVLNIIEYVFGFADIQNLNRYTVR